MISNINKNKIVLLELCIIIPKMIDVHLKYDTMHTNGIFTVLNFINNHINSFINCMLSPII